MSDAPAYLPPYARASRGTDVPLKAASVRRDDDLDDDHDGDGDPDDLDRDDEPAGDAGRPVREGLPPSYRMRHEPHYVEALVAPAVPSPPAVDPAPGAPAATEAVGAVPASGPDLGAVIDALRQSLDAIETALAQVSLRGRSLRDRVAVDLARAEAARARFAADAAAVLQADPLPSLDQVDLAAVCRAVDDAFAPEFRLAGGAPSITVPAASVPVFGDERLLTTAVGGVLAAVRALVEDRGDSARITIALGPRVDTATRTVEISQTAVRVPVTLHDRLFDPQWGGHPAGPTAALQLAAARRIAEAHGGALDVAATDGGGCRFSLSLPAAG
ncbi:MAG: ATP-binding protein [Vicinamibacterales bacterium]